MKILVLGSKGFVGSHVWTYFKSRPNIEVYGADVVVDYNTPNYFQLDASNADFKSLYETNNFDACINCSGAASVPDSIKRPLRDFILNTANVAKMLSAIKTYAPRCKFINLSSAAVYGNPASLPIKESQALNPISPYGTHKKQSEELCRLYAEQFDVPTCSLRIFSAYGPGIRKQLFWDLNQKVSKSNSIELFGTGLESRDFIHVQDLAKLIDLVLQKTPFKGEAINVANGEEITIKKVAEIFFGLYEKDIEFHFKGTTREGDPSNWVADISIIKSFGYKPEFKIQAGLESYYLWLQKELA